jgi:hypothetical protein
VLSIGGALLAVPTYFKPAIDKGEVAAVVDTQCPRQRQTLSTDVALGFGSGTQAETG